MTLARAAGAREYLDESMSPADRQTELADIHRLNAWFEATGSPSERSRS